MQLFVFRSPTPCRVLLALGLSLLSATVMARAGGAQSPAPAAPLSAEQEQEQAVRAEELTYRVCDECHAFDEVSSPRRTIRDWRTTVTAMINKGAVATKDELATITQYLIRYYGVVNVNTAPAEELSMVLGLSAKDAQAVVAHRTTVGRFAAVDEFLKVPGIDKAKIEEQPDALRFD